MITDVISGSSFKERAESMLVTEMGTDCVFLVGDGKNQIKASKAFLIRASPVFERMFCGDFPAAEAIEIPDIEPDVFNMMLKFVYGSNLVLESTEQVTKIFYAANKYMIRDLLIYCGNHFLSSKPPCVWSALEMANIYEEEKLRNAAMQIIERRSIDRIHDLVTRDVANASQATLVSVLKSNSLKISDELIVFKLCHIWAISKCKEKGLPMDRLHLRSELGEILHEIRFLAISPAKFVNDVVGTGILTAEESLSVTSYFLTKEIKFVTNGLCTITNCRGIL